MWVLIATVCTTLQADSCFSLAWTKTGFNSEKECAEAAITNTPALTSFVYAAPRCVFIPELPNV